MTSIININVELVISVIEDFHARTAQVQIFECQENNFEKACEIWPWEHERQLCHVLLLPIALCCIAVCNEQHNLTNAVIDCKLVVISHHADVKRSVLLTSVVFDFFITGASGTAQFDKCSY